MTNPKQLSREKLNDIWRSGYCRRVVKHAKTTKPGERQKRIDFLNHHMVRCGDCRYAAVMKMAEHRTAERMGPAALLWFEQGRDIRVFPDFDKNMRKTIASLHKAGLVDAEFIAWMHRVAHRRDYQEDLT